MAGSRRGTADWHFATGHFGRKRAIRRRGGGAGGGGDAPAAGTGRVSGTAEEVRAEEERAEEEHRPLARGPVGDAGVPAATRVYRRRKGGAAAERGKLRPMARGRPTGRQRRSSSCGHKAGRRNGGGGAGGEGGAPAAGTGPVRGAGVPAAKRRGGSRRRKTPAGGTPGSGTQKGLRCRRPVSGGPDYIIYYRFCSPRIRIATSRIVVSSNVTTPPSGPGSK